ncbi:MAG: hypothetical protein Q4P29_07220 [Tissierellia bacterium]|nr:hypothetical protein [Tissierellia bacterium]
MKEKLKKFKNNKEDLKMENSQSIKCNLRIKNENDENIELISEKEKAKLKEFLTEEEILAIEADLKMEKEMKDAMSGYELISYGTCHYDILLDDVEAELATGTLQLNETVQVFRSNEEISDFGIYPIIRWYYDDKKEMQKNVNYPDARKIYLYDKDELEKMTAAQLFAEFTTFARLFNPDAFYSDIKTDEEIEKLFETVRLLGSKTDPEQIEIANRNEIKRKKENKIKRRVRKIIKRKAD